MSTFRNRERVRFRKLGQAGLAPRLNADPQQVVFGDGSVGDVDDGQVIGGFTIGATDISAGTGNDYINMSSSGQIEVGSNTDGANYGRFNSTNLFIRTTSAFMSYLNGALEIGTYSFPTGSTNFSVSSSGTVTLFAGNIDVQAGTIRTSAGVSWGFGAASNTTITSPDKSLAVIVAGTTYYIPAKLTND